MFGTLRLILAALVALSHTISGPPGFALGVPAVIIFFLLSGYAMTGLIHKRFEAPNSAASFYLERIVRLLPQYYFWLPVASVLCLYLQWFPMQTDNFIPYGLFCYLTILPLGLQGFIEPIHTYLIGQASSLGIEVSFYLLSPWMLKSKTLSWLAAFTGLAIFIATYLGRLPAALYTYYSSPGAVILYIIGSFIYRREWVSVAALSGAMLVLLVIGLPQHYNIETIAGLIAGIPALIVLGKLKNRRWDTELGNASYGCFLGHGCVNIAFFHYIGLNIDSLMWQVKILAVPLSCMAGYLAFYIIERPTVAFRKSFHGQDTYYAVPDALKA